MPLCLKPNKTIKLTNIKLITPSKERAKAFLFAHKLLQNRESF